MNENFELKQEKKLLDYSYSSVKYPKYFGGIGGHIAALYEFYNPYSDTYSIGSTMNLNDRMTRHKSGLRNRRDEPDLFIKDYHEIINKGKEPEDVIQCKLVYSKVMIEMPTENEWFKMTNFLRTLENNAISEALSKNKKLYNIIRNVPTIITSKFSTGNVPSNAIPILGDNIAYISKQEAANSLNVSRDEITRRLKSSKFPGYKTITQKEYTELTNISIRRAPDAYNASKPLRGLLNAKRKNFDSIYQAYRDTGIGREIIRKNLNDPNNKDWEYL